EQLRSILSELPKEFTKAELITLMGLQMQGAGESSKKVDEFLGECLKYKLITGQGEGVDIKYYNPLNTTVDYGAENMEGITMHSEAGMGDTFTDISERQN
ncbi:hypothetical protein GYA13_03575, partial [Candidatus Kuenenbacteria bacterium]|nr:hypothetical protein [Candidatus Kuenenbacteria bacterium]